MGYDALGRVVSHSNALGSFTLGYLGQTGQLASRVSGAIGTQWSYGSNLQDRRLSGIATTPGASQFGYTTTAERDITAISQTINPQTWSYTYDLADRLKTAKTSLGGQGYSYGYDAASNLTTLRTPSGAKTVTPNASNQVASLGSTGFSYDANGNLLQDNLRTYAWDGADRLIGIAGTVGGTAYTTALSYDGLGRRVAMATVTGGVTSVSHYGWCGQRLCQSRSATDTPLRRYLAEGEYDAAQGALIYAPDQLGSARDVLAGSSGQSLGHFDYDPTGNATAATGSHANWPDFRYAGLFYHPTSGLYLATYRAYDPAIGRWLSRDPIGEEGGLNLCGYARNDPFYLKDPNGLDTIVSYGVGGTAAAGIGIGGSISIGAIVPDNPSNVGGWGIVGQVQGNLMAGGGVYGGVGTQYSVSHTEGPTTAGLNASHGWYMEADAGTGPASVGGSVQGDGPLFEHGMQPPNSGSLGGRLGVGAGVYIGYGSEGNVSVAITLGGAISGITGTISSLFGGSSNDPCGDPAVPSIVPIL